MGKRLVLKPAVIQSAVVLSHVRIDSSNFPIQSAQFSENLCGRETIFVILRRLSLEVLSESTEGPFELFLLLFLDLDRFSDEVPCRVSLLDISCTQSIDLG